MTTVGYGALDEEQATGENRLTLSIAADGTLTYAAAHQAMEPQLNKVILDSIQRWTYLPAVKHGQLQDAKAKCWCATAMAGSALYRPRCVSRRKNEGIT